MKKKNTSSKKKTALEQPNRNLFPEKLEKENELLRRVGVPEKA